MNKRLTKTPLRWKCRSIRCIGKIQEMLDFCVEHNIKPNVEIINMQDINTVYERMQKSDMKYQFIIDMGSLKR